MTLSAQGGGHEHIAPRAPGFDLTVPPSKVSPKLNQADQIWNMGESPNGRDIGGALGQDNPQAAPQPSFVPYPGTGGWQNLGYSGLVNYVGSFRNRGSQTNPADDTRASFEVVAPAVIEPGKKVVVALFTQSTFPGYDAKRAPHDYPGNPTYYDLLVTGGAGPHFDVVTRNLNGPALPYRVVGVQFVPRTSSRPAVFAMQRLRQVREATKYLLSQPPYNIAAGDIAYHVDCASFGGFTTQLAILFYPQEFHAGTAGAFSAAMRSVPCDFDSLVYFTSLMGMNGAGHSYTVRDTVDIPMWCRIEGTDLASVSSTNRWLLPLSHIQRPIYFFLGDEDTVTHGTDWVPILNRAAGQNGTQPQEGQVTYQTVVGNGHTVTVRWSIASKSGHGEQRPNGFKLMDNPPRDTDKLEDVLDLMLGEAYAQLAVPASNILPIDHSALGRKLSNQTALPSQDPSRDALGHRGVRQFTPGTRQGLLVDPPTTFRRYGQGTWLGGNESLKVQKVGTDPRASVFVGSADGFVTRLMMEPRTGGGQTIHPLVEKARSKLANGQPYALGHGVWGLAVGEVDPGIDGLEVVAASYNRIGLFKAVDLELIRERDLPDPADTRIPAERRWEYVDPRKVQIADLIDGLGGDGEIVFRTLHGHLVIMDRMLDIKYEHGEGGIVDFVVGPETSPAPWLRHPIYLLSARGHVARLEINTSLTAPFLFPNQGELAGASHLEYGGMRDLELLTWQGQQRLGALFIPHLDDSDAVRLFSLGDCTRVGAFGNIQAAAEPEAGLPPLNVLHLHPSGDQEPGFTYVGGHGGDRYVISSGGDLSVWDGAEVLGHKRLSTFPPASGHGSVQAGDLDESPSSPGDEVVVATSAGRIVWFKLSELLSDLTEAGRDLNMARAFVTDPVDGRVYEHRCNMSLAATWAMAATPATSTLQVIDAGGTWWEVDAQGKPTFVKELGAAATGLVPAGASSVALASGSGSQPHLAWQTFKDPPTSPETILASRPYVPAVFPGEAWWLPPTTPPFDLRPRIRHDIGHWVLPFGGARYEMPGATWLAWWQRAGMFTRFVQRVTYSVAGGQASVLDIWGSTQKELANNAPPPRFPPSHPDYVKAIRSELGEAAPSQLDAIRIGRVLPGDTPQVVTSGLGGRVTLLDGSTGVVVAESPDYGLGGLALAVGNLNGDDRDEIVFAPFYDPIAPGTSTTVRASLRVLSGASGSLTALGNPAGVPVGEATADFPGYGTCGIAIVDLSPWPSLQLGKVVIVTTFNGELVIFDVHPDGSLKTPPLLRKVVEGSIGAYGSIVVENFDPSSALPELYLAGSSGIRRFDFQ